jgi:phosphotransferase system enzyme I (PtsI)/phosphotransferase system enzyme I (PtsP)
MFPMVHDAEQVQELMHHVETAKTELANRGIVIEKSRQPTIGVMVEVPSAVREIEKISRRVDFISIGSSDLTQYTLAFERDPSADTDAMDERMYAPHHPAVMAKIADVIQCCQDKKLQVSVCGEMASDSAYVPLLLGAGLQIFSVAPRGARSVYDAIEGLDYNECRTLLSAVLASDGPIASLRLLEDFYRRQRERKLSDSP